MPGRARRAGAPTTLLESLQLGAYADAPAGSLPHGDERRLGVARALATEPRFVLMDEPAAGLPEAEVPAFAEVVRSVRDEHDAGVLLIDHNMALIMDVCDRIQVLDHGRTLAEGSPSEIRGNLDVAAAYLGRVGGASSDDCSSSRGLEVAYGGVAAVRGCRSSVAPGEIVGLIGPNGAGKSTTLHAIMGLVPPAGARSASAAARCAGARPSPIARSGVALVPEGRRLFGELTVEENLRLGLAARHARTAPEDDVAEIVELFPVVEEFRAPTCGALSGGQQQQLAIARALVARPSILLLDEPSLGLAPTIVDLVFSTLETIRDRGLGVLLVEQRAQRTVALADRTHVLANGELRLTLTPDDAADTDRMVAAYLS